jgi:branched-chain amino acid aminotransferase
MRSNPPHFDAPITVPAVAPPYRGTGSARRPQTIAEYAPAGAKQRPFEDSRMTQLQRPPYVFMGGRLTPWDEAKIHVSAEALIRGISVFEGIKGYWDADGREVWLLALPEHFRRLHQSAEMVHLPFSMGYEEFRQACATIVRAIVVPKKDLWLRPTVFPLEGSWGTGTVTDLVITSYTQEMKRPDPIEVGISAWQRPSDSSQPARLKSAANYQVSRNARIEGRLHGFQEMVLLNSAGRVAEATGAAIAIVRDGTVITPPASEGCLESITINIVEKICTMLSIPFVRRPVDRSELYVADEMCIAGTLAELAVVRRVDYRKLPPETPVLAAVTDVFWDLVRSRRKVPGVELTRI